MVGLDPTIHSEVMVVAATGGVIEVGDGHFHGANHVTGRGRRISAFETRTAAMHLQVAVGVQMQSSDLMKRVRYANWILVALGVWLIWMSWIVLDPEWSSNRGLGPLLVYLHPIPRAAASLALALLVLLTSWNFFRIGRSDNLEINDQGVEISGFFRRRSIRWEEVGRIGFRFEPIPAIIFHPKSGQRLPFLEPKVGTAPSRDKLQLAIDYVSRRYPNLLEHEPLPAPVIPTPEVKRQSAKAHLISFAVTLPLLVVMVVLGHYDRNLQQGFLCLLLIGFAAFIGVSAYRVWRTDSKSDNAGKMVVLTLLVIVLAIILYMTVKTWRVVDWPNLLSVIQALLA